MDNHMIYSIVWEGIKLIFRDEYSCFFTGTQFHAKTYELIRTREGCVFMPLRFVTDPMFLGCIDVRNFGSVTHGFPSISRDFGDHSCRKIVTHIVSKFPVIVDEWIERTTNSFWLFRSLPTNWIFYIHQGWHICRWFIGELHFYPERLVPPTGRRLFLV